MTPFKQLFGEDGFADQLSTEDQVADLIQDQEQRYGEERLDEDQEYKDQEINSLKAN